MFHGANKQFFDVIAKLIIIKEPNMLITADDC